MVSQQSKKLWRRHDSMVGCQNVHPAFRCQAPAAVTELGTCEWQDCRVWRSAVQLVIADCNVNRSLGKRIQQRPQPRRQHFALRTKETHSS